VDFPLSFFGDGGERLKEKKGGRGEESQVPSASFHYT